VDREMSGEKYCTVAQTRRMMKRTGMNTRILFTLVIAGWAPTWILYGLQEKSNNISQSTLTYDVHMAKLTKLLHTCLYTLIHGREKSVNMVM